MSTHDRMPVPPPEADVLEFTAPVPRPSCFVHCAASDITSCSRVVVLFVYTPDSMRVARLCYPLGKRTSLLVYAILSEDLNPILGVWRKSRTCQRGRKYHVRDGREVCEGGCVV